MWTLLHGPLAQADAKDTSGVVLFGAIFMPSGTGTFGGGIQWRINENLRVGVAASTLFLFSTSIGAHQYVYVPVSSSLSVLFGVQALRTWESGLVGGSRDEVYADLRADAGLELKFGSPNKFVLGVGGSWGTNALAAYPKVPRVLPFLYLGTRL